MGAESVSRFSSVRLRRHGLRPLCFEGALLVRAGEPEEPQIRLYEIADGALAVAIELPGRYVDAWRLESLDEVIELIVGFNPVQRLGFDVAAALDESAGAEATAQALEDRAAELAPAYLRVVNSFLRMSSSPAL